MHTPTGATMYSLVYVAEVIIPINIEFPSLRIFLQKKFLHEEYQVAHLQELQLLDERHLNFLNHLHTYQNNLWLQYNKKIKLHEFEVGDLFPKQN